MRCLSRSQSMALRMGIAAALMAWASTGVEAQGLYILKIVGGPRDSQEVAPLIIKEEEIRGYRLRTMDDGRERLDILLTRRAAQSLKQFTTQNLHRNMTFYWQDKELGSDRITGVIANGVISLMVSNWDVHELKRDIQQRGLLGENKQ